MRYRKTTWLNTKTMQPEYGIQACKPRRNIWAHVCEAGKPLIFKTEGERDTKLVKIKCEELSD